MVVQRFFDDFKDFIKEYGVISVAVAFVMGQATNELVKSFVNNIIMPFLNPIVKNGGWETAILHWGYIQISWGLFVAAALNFIIMALIVFIVIKKVMKREVKKK